MQVERGGVTKKPDAPQTMGFSIVLVVLASHPFPIKR